MNALIPAPLIQDETSLLRAIVVHRPMRELDRMIPANLEPYHTLPDGRIVPNRDYLLFDDLVFRTKLRQEHAQIVQVLEAVCGEHAVLEVADLIRTILYAPSVRAELVDRLDEVERVHYDAPLSDLVRGTLLDAEPEALLIGLLDGVLPSGLRVLRWPIPNLLFARDLGVVVGDAILLTYARKAARAREMLLSRAVFRSHPWFQRARILDIADDGLSDPALEGGDVIVLSRDEVLIGVGERTNLESARAAAARLLATGVQAVHVVALHDARSTMHLDTVFTLLDRNRCLVYRPHVLDSGRAAVRTIDRAGEHPRAGSLLDVLRSEGRVLEPVHCGGPDPESEMREQWSDGANAFAIAPGKVLLYARNEQTLRHLNEAGFEVMLPGDFCRNAALYLSGDRRVVIGIEGSELSRGRGGPRCLTMPVARM